VNFVNKTSKKYQSSQMVWHFYFAWQV